MSEYFSVSQSACCERAQNAGHECEVHSKHGWVEDSHPVWGGFENAGSYQAGEDTKNNTDAENAETPAGIDTDISGTVDGRIFSTLDETGEEAHDTAEEEHSHAITGVVNGQSPENLCGDFLEEGSEKSEHEDSHEFNSADDRAQSDNVAQSAGNSVNKGVVGVHVGFMGIRCADCSIEPILAVIYKADFLGDAGTPVLAVVGVGDTCLLPEIPD